MNSCKNFSTILSLLTLFLACQVADAQQNLAQQAYGIFEQHCLNCHGEFGPYADALVIQHANLIDSQVVIPGNPDASELYLRLLGNTASGAQMPFGQAPLNAQAIATIRRWIEAGAPNWDAFNPYQNRFITNDAMLGAIRAHVTSLSAFDRPYARYFTLTHFYNAGASGEEIRVYRNALSKLVNSLSWGVEVIKPTPIDPAATIFYIDLRHYEWDRNNQWDQIEQAYPYVAHFPSPTYATLCQETNCEVPFIRADWFIATASLPPLYYEMLDLPENVYALEEQLAVNVAENLQNAPGVRVWRAGFSESGVSNNNRVVERHASRYGAYWKTYDFAGNVDTQNIFVHPLDFTPDGGEIIFHLPNGLQGYYLTNAAGERLDDAPIDIVSDTGARDPVVRNGLSCMGCHTDGMKTFEDQVRTVVEQTPHATYDREKALRLYVEKPAMDALVRKDTERYRWALEATGGVFGETEPIQRLVKQFEAPLDVTHAAAELGLETADFLQKIRENRRLQNLGLSVLTVEKGSVKRDRWESQFALIFAITFYADDRLSIPTDELQIGGINSLSFSMDGSILAGGVGNAVVLWDGVTGEHLKTLIGHKERGFYELVTFSADGRTLASGGSEGILLWDAITGELRVILTDKYGVISLAFSADGRILASAGGGAEGVLLWDVVTGTLLKKLSGHGSPFYVAFSTVDSTLASARGNEVQLWDSVTGEHMRTFEGHPDWISSIAFSPDGFTLASGGEGEIRLWDVNTGTHLKTLAGHTNHAYSLAFSPDGRILASGSSIEKEAPDINAIYEEGEMRLWDTSTGALLATVPMPELREVLTLAFSPDGRTLASGGGNRIGETALLETTLFLWDIEPFTGSVAWQTQLASDVNGDGSVNILDLVFVSANFGNVTANNRRADVNGDGTVNILDLTLIAQHFSESQ